MPRTITVKGIGKVSAKPDYVVLSMSMESKNRDYDEAMSLAEQKIAQLNESLASVGFEKDSVKTTDFIVSVNYKYHKDYNGNSYQEFDGYVVKHKLKVSFDFSSERLSEALSAVAGCLSKPDLSVSFTVKDQTAIQGELLRSATANARSSAEILCQASGEKLGELLSINYNWGELDVYSHTSYEIEDKCLLAAKPMDSIDMEPDDIDVSDTVTFMWELG